MKKSLFALLSSLIAAIFAPMTAGAQEKTASPDFAYPKEVIKNADAMLNKALSEGDGQKVVESLIQYGLAETSISADSLPSVTDKIERVRDGEKSPVTQSLLNLLLADIYRQYYSNDRYNIDKRTQVDADGDNFTLWSGNQFKQRIEKLCLDALANQKELQAQMIEDYSGIINGSTLTSVFYPTLFDFASSKAASILDELTESQAVYPAKAVYFYWATPNSLSPANRVLVSILDNWKKAQNTGSAAFAQAEVVRARYMQGYVYGEENPSQYAFRFFRMYYKSNPYAVEVLLNNIDYSGHEAEMLGYLTLYKEKWPHYVNNDAVDNLIARIKAPSVEVTMPNFAAKGVSAKFKAKMTNCATAKVNIYALKSGRLTDGSYRRKDFQSTPCVTVPLEANGTIPFSADVTAEFTLPDYGVYFAEVEGNETKANSYVEPIRCSDIAIVSNSLYKDVNVWALNPINGKPIQGVTIKVADVDRKRNVLATLVTDKNGKAVIPSVAEGIRITASKGSDKYSNALWNGYYDREQRKVESAYINTDLPIYHPGDSVDVAAILYAYDSKGRSLLKSAKCELIVRNPNWQPVDTLRLTTDTYGRVYAKFRAPKDGLTGRYQITARCEKRNIGSCSFMVSDYKLPTFEISLEKPKVEGKDVVIDGKSIGYNGFPVQGGEVKVSLEGFRNRFWYRSANVEFHVDTLTTDAKGQFQIRVTPEILEWTPFPGGGVKATVVVTSASGESQQADTEFSVGKSYFINAGALGLLRSVADAKLPFALYDFVNEPVDGDLNIKFERGGESYEIKAIAKGNSSTADLSGLPSGEYAVEITAPGTDAEPVNLSGVNVYNAADKNSPSDGALWVLEHEIELNADSRTAEMTYAVSSTDTHLLYTLSAGDKILERKWLSPKNGINTLKVKLPAGVDDAAVALMTVKDFKTWVETTKIKVAKPAEKLNVKIERMRDKVTPSSSETITLKVTDGAGSGTSAAVILDMYSKALNSLENQSWQFRPGMAYQPMLFVNGFNRGLVWTSYNPQISFKPVNVIAVPEYNFYGMSFVGSNVQFMEALRGSVPGMKVEAATSTDMEAGLDNSVVERKLYAAAGKGEIKIRGSHAMADSEEESVEEESAYEGVANEEGTADTHYRPSEVALAFFAPNLTTDSEGNLEYSFTVPNANTTWALYALAFTDNVAAADTYAEIISSKPVMVEPNMPRFIRQGDKAIIRASVMNTTDSAQRVATLFELLNGADMKVVDNAEKISEIGPNSSAVVDFEIEAGAGVASYIVRVKSSNDMYTDGVQTLLPVLPASQPVIDSETFYLTNDQKEFSMPINKGKGTDNTTTVSFCENPTWEVVSALPGLRSDDSDTSLAASAAIFSAAVAGKVMDLNPGVEEALKQWLAGAKDDATLLSMLNRNEDLKQLTLASTPWIQNAVSDNERLTRLALLFDRSEITGAIDKAMKQLEKLQTASGGWSWTSSFNQPSEWVTLQILNNFAELRQLEACPAELDAMVRKAWKYIDAEIAKDYAKYPKGDYLFYTYVRGLYPEISLPLGAQKAFDATIKSVRAGWKNLGTTQKAAAALMLYRANNKIVANEILASLRQFAASSPKFGMWWDSVDGSTVWSLNRTGQTAFILEAFNAIDPGCADIDKIRQWLILNKVVQDWGTSVNASACVASILQCGSDWLYKPGNVKVAVDGNVLNPSEVDSLTGSFVLKVDAPKGNLTISRSGEGPAWGAVVNQSTQVMTDIKAASIPELSIQKQILVNEGNGWADANDLAVGQTAKVRLIINSMRDMDYVTIVDNRAATMEPVVQTPRPVYCDGLMFYLENRDAATNLFISRLPKGQYVIEYEMYVNNAGSYSTGIATIQSQYAPEMTAHSSGRLITVD